jgi:hypothetical protein
MPLRTTTAWVSAVAGEGGEDAGGDLDADGELGDRAGVSGGVSVDDGDELGLGGSWPGRCRPGAVCGFVVGVVVEGFVEQEAGGGVGGEVALLLDRIARTFVGDRLGEHGLHHGVDACCDADAGDGVELGGQVPHPFGIHPRPCAYVAALAGEAVHAVVVLQAFAFHVQPAGELLDGARSGDIGQRVGTRDQLGLLGPSSCLEARVTAST